MDNTGHPRHPADWPVTHSQSSSACCCPGPGLYCSNYRCSPGCCPRPGLYCSNYRCSPGCCPRPGLYCLTPGPVCCRLCAGGPWTAARQPRAAGPPTSLPCPPAGAPTAPCPPYTGEQSATGPSVGSPRTVVRCRPADDWPAALATHSRSMPLRSRTAPANRKAAHKLVTGQ